MLIQRVATALVLFLFTLFCMLALPKIFSVVIVLLLFLMAIHEMFSMYKFSLTQKILGILLAIACACACYFINFDLQHPIQIIAIINWCIIVPALLIKQPKNFNKLIIVILSLLLFIPAFEAFITLNELLGPIQLISIMAVAWVADTGAYFIGKSLGKNKLAPSISPGKTIEGVLGGFICVIIYLFTLKFFKLTFYLHDYPAVFTFGLILTTFSILGDLFESWIKRVSNSKDSSKILPGHGGIFDRIDSLIAVITIAFAIIEGLI